MHRVAELVRRIIFLFERRDGASRQQRGLAEYLTGRERAGVEHELVVCEALALRALAHCLHTSAPADPRAFSLVRDLGES